MRPQTVQHRRIIGALAIIAGVLIGFFGFIAVAQTPRAEESTAAELIGAGVFSAEGAEVGKVSAVTVARDGQITEIRFTTASRFGLDARTVRSGRTVSLR